MTKKQDWTKVNMQEKQEEAIAKAIYQLKALQQDTDTESAHAEADDILCNLLNILGCKKVVAAYEEVPKWYA